MKKIVLVVIQIGILLAVSLPLTSENKKIEDKSKGLILCKKLDGLKNGREVQIHVRDKYVGDDLAGKKTLFRLTDKRGNIRNRIMTANHNPTARSAVSFIVSHLLVRDDRLLIGPISSIVEPSLVCVRAIARLYFMSLSRGSSRAARW